MDPAMRYATCLQWISHHLKSDAFLWTNPDSEEIDLNVMMTVIAPSLLNTTQSRPKQLQHSSIAHPSLL